jgi:diacylglycerol kinase (ATP)
MKITIILNGISLNKKFFYHEIFPAVCAVADAEVFETRSRNDAWSLASKAVERQTDLILAAGGDGTIYQVLNGILQGREKHRDLPAMGVLPVGTGNDFAKALKMPSDAAATARVVKNFVCKPFDIGKVQYTTEQGSNSTRYFINVADIGMGPQVVEKVMKSGRPFGVGMAYYKSILSTFFTYTPMTIRAKAPAWEWESKMRTFAVANGQYYGDGLCIAPDAKPDDGMFEVFACADVSILDFILHSIPLKMGKRINHPKVSYLRTTSVELTSQAPCAVEADGEAIGWLPARIEMAPFKLNFLVP